jgi:hypothetical protein
MRSIEMKKIYIALLFLGFTFLSCDSETKKAEYYIQIGGISVAAYNSINSTPGLSAQQALAYCNQYPVYPDPYKDVRSGVSRSKLESDIDSLGYVEGFSKTQFLRMLDTSGAVFQMFILQNGDYMYAYVEEQ